MHSKQKLAAFESGPNVPVSELIQGQFSNLTIPVLWFTARPNKFNYQTWLKYYYSGGAAINESYGVFDYLDQVNMSQFHDDTAQVQVASFVSFCHQSVIQWRHHLKGNFDIRLCVWRKSSRLPWWWNWWNLLFIVGTCYNFFWKMSEIFNRKSSICLSESPGHH